MTILDEICAHKRQEVEVRQAALPMHDVERRAAQADQPRPFQPAHSVALIAEVKRRSPSKGDLVTTLDPIEQARAYEQGGADAISVLTDARYFGGGFADLEAVRTAVRVPVLCKDFILTEYQVYEARAHGADLLLLIVAAMNDRPLIALHDCTRALGMTPLVEVHDQHDLARALAIDAQLIGINNRDLADFSVDLLTTEYLAPLIPDDVTVISESGIATRADVERVVRAGARGVLVGEALMRSDDPAGMVRELIG